MPIYLGGVVLLLQAFLAVHAFRTGRERWAYLIIMVPALGGLIYFLTQILPDLQRNSAARRVSSDVARMVNPTRDLRRLRENLDIVDTVQNRQLLARECVNVGLYQEAIELYKDCLQGRSEHEPYIMLELATAYFAGECYPEAKDTFLRLRETNPEFQSSEGHLMYARTLEYIEENNDSLREYETVAAYFPGEEANCRYALLLKRNGRTEKANEIFHQVLTRDRRRSRQHKRREKQWVDISRQNLA